MTVMTIWTLFLYAYNSSYRGSLLTKCSAWRQWTILKQVPKTDVPEIIAIGNVSHCFCFEWLITISALSLDAYNSNNGARTLTKVSGLKHWTIVKALAETCVPEVAAMENVTSYFCYDWPSWQYERYFYILITPEVEEGFCGKLQDKSSGPF